MNLITMLSRTRKYPTTRAMSTPATVLMTVTEKPTRNDSRVPTIVRSKTSLPQTSVPKIVEVPGRGLQTIRRVYTFVLRACDQGREQRKGTVR